MKKRMINHVFSLALLLGLVWTMTSGCTYAAQGVKGDGNVVKQERSVGPFSGIEVGGAFKVFLTQGSAEALVVEADENLLQYIDTDVRGNTLTIKNTKEINNPKALNVYVTFKDLNELDISGACHLVADDKLKFDNLELECSGASEVNLKMSAEKLSLDCSGASQMELYGVAGSMDLDVSGASHLDASELEVKTCEADVSGASHAKIFVSDELSADVSGAASLKYKGDAVLKDHDVSGAGSLKKY